MPSQTWNNTVGSGSNSTITLAYDSISVSGGSASLVNPRIEFYSRPGWSDSSNYIEGRGAVTTQRWTNTTLDGGTKTFPLAASSINIAYGSTTATYLEVAVYSVEFFNGGGKTSTFRMDIDLPARPYSLPNPATNFTNALSGANAYLSWTPNYTGSNGATPWSNQYIDRTETGDWAGATQVAALGWEPTNWTDTTLQPNKRYNYRHRATNPAGSSQYAYAANAPYTKPAAPTAVTAAKQTDGSIQVTFTNKAPWATAFEISDSANGTSWTELTSTHAGGTYTHSSPNSSVTHRYRVRAKTPDGQWSDYSTVSNIVQLQAPPNAPTWLAWIWSVDAREPVTITWQHNPVDTTAQSAYEIQWRSSTNGGSSWSGWTTTGKVTSATSSRTFAANTFPQNALIDRQVRTWGAHATASPWSASETFRTSARPTAGITYPASGGTDAAKRITVTWTYADAEGSAQSAWRVVLKTGAGVYIDQWSGSNANTSFAVPYDLADATSYRVEVTVRDGASVWSLPTEVTFSVAYVPPPAPVFTTSWDEEKAAAILTIGNPDPVAPQPAAVTNNVYRDGKLIATGLPLGTTFVDPLPQTGFPGSSYVVEAVSALPSMGPSAPQVLAPTDEINRRFWINGGLGFAKVASFYGNVSRSRTSSLNKSTEHYAGRSLPVETIGEAVSEGFSFSSTVVQSEDPPAVFHDLARTPTTMCFREPSGRYFVSLGDVGESTTQDITANLSLSMTTVDYREGVLGQ